MGRLVAARRTATAIAPWATMTSGLDAMTSATRFAARSGESSPQWASRATWRPST
jgi:hypothetical protein